VPAGIFSDNIKIQQHWGFINGPAALVYLVGHKDASALLMIVPPAGWSSTVPLDEQKRGDEVIANSFLAPDYDTLADSPIVFADDQGMKVYTFKQDGTDFKVVCFRHPDRIKSVPDLLQTLKTIAHTEADVMGGMDTNHYSFVFDIDGFAAGLEHLNSFRIGLASFIPPARQSSFIGHEFFHQWNVKRIRPAVLGPFDYINPPKTNNLWFAEGVTEYYAQVCSHRGGFNTADRLLAHFASQHKNMLRNEARKTVTAEESSMRVWEAGNSEGFGGLSYYEKGELIGLCLDLKIRAVTGGKKSLDDVMRLLMKRHAPPLPGYGEDELRLTVNEVAGQDLSDLYNRIVRSTAEMPIADLLAPFGLDDQFQPLATETPAQKSLREGWLEGTKP
jgi:predicted metalloprotease with PDZ domain